MPGGLMQLISYGAEDLFLTGNPQISFFKVVYRRHTNFATEFIEVYFDTKPTFDPVKTTTMKVKIPRHGDMISKLFLVYDLPAIVSSTSLNAMPGPYQTSPTEAEDDPMGQGFKWVTDVGNRIINTIQLTIGGQVINKLYGQWLSIWNDLTVPDSKKNYYKAMIGNTPILTNPDQLNGLTHITNNCASCTITSSDLHPTADTVPNFNFIPRQRLYIPIDFWFTESPGLSLPLISLQYVDTEIQIEFNPLNELYTIKSPAPDEIIYSHPCITADSCSASYTKESIETFKQAYYTDISPKNFYENFNYTITAAATTPNNYERFFGSTTYSEYTMFNYFVGRGIEAENNVISEWSQNCYFLTQYVYLDDDERIRMAQNSHEYLITQTRRENFSGLSGENTTVELKFNHPIKELIWCFQHDVVSYFNKWNTYTFDQTMRSFANTTLDWQFYERIPRTSVMNSFDNGFNILYNAVLKLNGHERFKPRDSNYFAYVEPFLHHSGDMTRTIQHTYTPLSESVQGTSSTATPQLINVKGLESGIYVYSFALEPEQVQPTGSCNFSRINKAQMKFDIRGGSSETAITYDLYVYARNVNVLRIMGGVGNIVFAN
jgi:hypothetical protein